LPPGSTGANGGHQHGAATPDNSQQQHTATSGGGGSHQHTPTHTPPAGVTRSLSDHTGKMNNVPINLKSLKVELKSQRNSLSLSKTKFVCTDFHNFLCKTQDNEKYQQCYAA
jgi:hypothetical protein